MAAAIVPCAIVVHLAAEAAAIGERGLTFDFIVRHEYFGALFLAAASWFGATVGLGRPVSERRRRCALLRANLDGKRYPYSLPLLLAANLAFFSLTQLVEGVPIASGGMGRGLGIALAGSLVSALLVFLFGRSLVVASLDSVIGTSPLQFAPATFPSRAGTVPAPRTATSAYSLFIPNRPPPTASRI